MIRLSRESMEAAFVKYLETVFVHPEIISAGVRNIAISRENIKEAGKRAFEASFHDSFSDIDLSVKVCPLPCRIATSCLWERKGPSLSFPLVERALPPDQPVHILSNVTRSLR